MVTVRYTETYDLSTQVDKMGLIAIHTPSLSQLAELYPGLITNHRFIHVDSCDVVCACASVLPADPLQVGTEAGDIAPQDMFNPILYKAVSNDSFNTVLNRLYSLTNTLGGNTGSVDATDDAFNDTAMQGPDDFDLYYSILGSQDGWKKALPQQGFSMSGLYPILYHLMSTFGNAPPTQSGLAGVISVNQSGVESSTSLAQTMRGPSCRMPRLPLHYGFPVGTSTELSIKAVPTETADVCPVMPVDTYFSRVIPKTYVACILTPPAKLHKLYYRMRVTWTFTFQEVIPVTEYARPRDIGVRASYLYASDYAEQSKNMDNIDSTVDTKDVGLERIMTAGK